MILNMARRPRARCAGNAAPFTHRRSASATSQLRRFITCCAASVYYAGARVFTPRCQRHCRADARVRLRIQASAASAMLRECQQLFCRYADVITTPPMLRHHAATTPDAWRDDVYRRGDIHFRRPMKVTKTPGMPTRLLFHTCCPYRQMSFVIFPSAEPPPHALRPPLLSLTPSTQIENTGHFNAYATICVMVPPAFA